MYDLSTSVKENFSFFKHSLLTQMNFNYQFRIISELTYHLLTKL